MTRALRRAGVIATAWVSLLLPGHAAAEPAAAGQWGAEESEAAESEAAEDIVILDDEPEDAAEVAEAEPAPAADPKAKAKAKPKKRRKKRAKAGPKAGERRGPPPPPPSGAEKSAEELQEDFEGATRSGERVLERRRRAEERAAEQVERGGSPLEAARDLAVIAELDDDPVLMIGAAEAALQGVGVASGAGEAAQLHAGAAKARLEELTSSEDEYALLRLGLEGEDVHQLEVRVRSASTRASVALARAERADNHSRSVRVAKGELVSGAVLAGLGVSGFAMMGSGIYLGRSADRELDAAGVKELSELSPEFSAPFEQQYSQASTLTAVGAVLGAVGTTLGVTLIATGVRDLKRSGWRSGKRASLRAAPTVGRGAAGLVIGGRF